MYYKAVYFLAIYNLKKLSEFKGDDKNINI